MNTNEMIRDTYRAHPGSSPETLAGLVWTGISEDEYQHLAWAQVKQLCREHIGNERRRPVHEDIEESVTYSAMESYVDDMDINLTSEAPTLKKVSSARGRVAERVRKDLAQWLNDGFFIEGLFRTRATLTVNDLLLAAAERRTQAAQNEHWAAIYEEQASILEQSGAQTVGDLDEATLRTMVKVEK